MFFCSQKMQNISNPSILLYLILHLRWFLLPQFIFNSSFDFIVLESDTCSLPFGGIVEWNRICNLKTPSNEMMQIFVKVTSKLGYFNLATFNLRPINSFVTFFRSWELPGRLRLGNVSNNKIIIMSFVNCSKVLSVTLLRLLKRVLNNNGISGFRSRWISFIKLIWISD